MAGGETRFDRARAHAWAIVGKRPGTKLTDKETLRWRRAYSESLDAEERGKAEREAGK